MSLQKRQAEAALRMVSKAQVVFGPHRHEYRAATLNEFPELDRGFYDRLRDWFESRGYSYLGDCENVTLSSVYPDKRTVIRRMVGELGTVCVDLHHIRIVRKNFRRDHKTVDLETGFIDGTFVLTSNALDSARLSPVPTIDHLKMPRDIEPELLLLAHRDRIAQRLSEKSDIAAIRVQTMEEAYEFQHRLHAIAAKFRREEGYITREDIEQIKGRALTRTEEGIVSELEKLKATING
ncbi:MAG: hypothetical protein ABSD28_16890 [Tepidisphaeraceae bacterium]|jgi:hypothetical protein